MKSLKKKFCIPLKVLTLVFTISITLSIILSNTMNVFAETPYRAYYYNYWEDAIEIPNPYLPSTQYEKEHFGELGLNSPQDIFYDNDKYIYIADTGNNRIIKLDTNYDVVKIISEFNGDTFNTPTGIFVDDENKIYVCDSLNNRIVVLDENGELLLEIKDIENSILPENFIFLPQKIAVDKVGRMYVLAQNVFEGLMTFDTDGEFTGYFGTINVSYDPLDLFWKSVATEEQKSKMVMFIPTEFTNLDIDEKGFIYTTEMKTNSESKVKKLNPSGKNVLINYSNNEIAGDLITRGETGSYFVDINITDSGIYMALDRTNGRIFTYDSEGNNIYNFGVIGNEFGNVKSPVAIETVGEDVVVLDSELDRIIVFEPTHFGSLINEALNLRYNGDESEAVELWKEVLEISSNYEIASKGIGKAYLSSGDNVEAMHYLKEGYDRKNYSVAFKRFRNDLLQNNIHIIISVVIGLILIYNVFKFYKKRKMKNNNKNKEGEING